MKKLLISLTMSTHCTLGMEFSLFCQDVGVTDSHELTSLHLSWILNCNFNLHSKFVLIFIVSFIFIIYIYCLN